MAPALAALGEIPEKQNAAPKGGVCGVLEYGAGEAIRTPDPNLGKVVLYP